MPTKSIVSLALLLFITLGCRNSTEQVHRVAAYNLWGEPLYAPQPSPELSEKYDARKKAYLGDVHNMDALIWYGRYAAYMGRYDEAIELFSTGIREAPRDSRFYRHRGHRYITTRQFDKAIIDLQKARELIRGTQNSIEPDGMPNARNVPVSTLHGNIYYHLGLAYYLNGRLPQALDAYLSCLEASTLPDNIVSSTHWIYMILRRMGRTEEANEILKPIQENMDIIENFSYYRLCLFYKGLITEKDLLTTSEDSAADDAVRYGLANWYIYNNQSNAGYNNLREIIKGSNWASFGYIAAEADIHRYRPSR